MSKPPVNPEKSLAGIAVDPRTLERVIPESKRSDGTIRKERKVRPGFTPQEDISRFRGSRQAQMDARALPKGHIFGWTPPSDTTSPSNKPAGAGLSKSQKKNQKRKEKREADVSKKIKDNWEEEDEEVTATNSARKEDEVIDTEADRSNDDGLVDEFQRLEVK